MFPNLFFVYLFMLNCPILLLTTSSGLIIFIFREKKVNPIPTVRRGSRGWDGVGNMLFVFLRFS